MRSHFSISEYWVLLLTGGENHIDAFVGAKLLSYTALFSYFMHLAGASIIDTPFPQLWPNCSINRKAVLVRFADKLTYHVKNMLKIHNSF